jgi:YihY family inner membrane protein
VVALAVRLGEGVLQEFLHEAIDSVAPGPAGEIFLGAFEQGTEVGRANALAIVIGGGAALIAAIAGMAQLQRGATRIYGIDEDRPTFNRYLLATSLVLTVGAAMTVAFFLIVLGGSVGEFFSDDVADERSWLRWPVGMLLTVLSLAGLFKAAPNRPQPSIGWLAVGALVASVGWLLVSVLLAEYVNASQAFGETYGPLAGFIGLMFWCQFSSIAIFYGVAISAELEYEAGGAKPESDVQKKADA